MPVDEADKAEYRALLFEVGRDAGYLVGQLRDRSLTGAALSAGPNYFGETITPHYFVPVEPSTNLLPWQLHVRLNDCRLSSEGCPRR